MYLSTAVEGIPTVVLHESMLHCCASQRRLVEWVEGGRVRKRFLSRTVKFLLKLLLGAVEKEKSSLWHRKWKFP